MMEQVYGTTEDQIREVKSIARREKPRTIRAFPRVLKLLWKSK